MRYLEEPSVSEIGDRETRIREKKVYRILQRKIFEFSHLNPTRGLFMEKHIDFGQRNLNTQPGDLERYQGADQNTIY